MESNQKEAKWIPVLEWVLLIAITSAAIFLRYWRLEEVPPGFNSDEAVGAIGALTTLREGLQYSYEGQGGGGALGFYLAAITFYLFGPSIAAIRGLAAGAGVFSVFVNYWAIREVFRLGGLNRARWIAGLSTLGLTFSIWHISASRVAFAGIGVPLFLMPSVYFLWLGLNKNTDIEPGKKTSRWPFAASGLFLGFLMYIYLSGVFVPPLYAAFFIAQWVIVLLVKKFKGNPLPQNAYLTSQFWNLFITGLVATLLLLPMVYVLLFRAELEPGTTRASQAFFLNPQINQGNPWGLLWRAIVGNFGAYGISLSWLAGRPPTLSMLPVQTGLIIFLGFLISLWYIIKGRAAHLFIVLWYCILLLPSILSPDAIPHNLRTIGATSPTFTLAAIFIVWLFDMLLATGKRWLQPRMNSAAYKWATRGIGLILAVALIALLWNPTKSILYRYFYIFPNTNDAQAAYHVYAVEMAKEINVEKRPYTAFILPRNTAAGDVFRNFTTDFLVELEQPPNSHYWVQDDERTLPDDLTTAAANNHYFIRVVEWLTSKHTGADPKGVIPYYLEKYGYHDHTLGFEYFKTHDYKLEVESPNFNAAETLQPVDINFDNQLTLTGFALGDAGDVTAVTQPQARSNDLLWLRLRWQKTRKQAENLKASAQIFNQHGQLVTQIDKDLISNLLQVGSSRWDINATEYSYFLIPIPPATPPGTYTVQLAVYGEDSLNRLPILDSAATPDQSITLHEITVTPAVQRAKPEHVTVALPLDQQILPDFTLLGLETLPGQTVRTGQQVNADVLWLAGENAPDVDLEMTFVAQSPQGGQDHALSEPVTIATPNYPPAQWQSGEVLRGWLNARIPLELEPGPYQLSLRVTEAGNPNSEIATVPLGDFIVTGWPRNFDAPQPAVEIGADYSGLATLLGLDANTNTLAPGDTLNAQLYWQATTEFSDDYTAFVQLIGPDGLLYGQVDQTPGAGQYPTTGWLPNEYITDAYTVPLAPDAPPGDYQIAIGFYNPNTGQRLPVTGPNCQPDVCLQPGLTVK